jgi:hypothetical protein
MFEGHVTMQFDVPFGHPAGSGGCRVLVVWQLLTWPFRNPGPVVPPHGKLSPHWPVSLQGAGTGWMWQQPSVPSW